MTAWLKLESNFLAAWNEKSPRVPDAKRDLALFFQDIAAQPGFKFNREEVARKDREFAKLKTFIEQFSHSAVDAA